MVRALQNFTDDQLVVLLKQDNEQAFSEIYSRYWPQMYASAYKRLRSRETTEELVQDLFTSLWSNRASLIIHTSLAAYLSRAIKYIVINHIQKELVRKNYTDQQKMLSVRHHNATDEEIMLNDLQICVDKQISSLPSKCRTVFELSRYENHSMKEIAGKLAISEKTVENHIGRALKILKVSLKDFVTLLLPVISFLL
jgi:RNA polymerase sigma-70 factor (family 1)